MFKKLPFLFFIGTSLILTAQTSIEKELEILETPEQIESYLETKKSVKNKLVTFNEENHKTILAKELFKLNVGGTKVNDGEFEKTYFKVIKKSKNTYYRVAYIYLDHSKFNKEYIDTLKEKIITQYNYGKPFDILAKQYSMDENANKGGDLGWFLEGEMPDDFEDEAVKGNHKLNDIFTIDIPSEKSSYVILKTHEPKDILEIEVLKIVESKN